MDAILPKPLLLLNGGKDIGIDIRTIRKFANDMRPRYSTFLIASISLKKKRRITNSRRR